MEDSEKSEWFQKMAEAPAPKFVRSSLPEKQLLRKPGIQSIKKFSILKDMRRRRRLETIEEEPKQETSVLVVMRNDMFLVPNSGLSREIKRMLINCATEGADTELLSDALGQFRVDGNHALINGVVSSVYRFD